MDRFTSLPTQKHPEGSAPRDITRHHMDLTYTLTSMLTSCYNNCMLSRILGHIIIIMYVCNTASGELLGEVQFSFICFLIGHGKHYILHCSYCIVATPAAVVYEAFEQWKRLICLLCSCEEAIVTQHDLYNSFIGKSNDRALP